MKTKKSLFKMIDSQIITFVPTAKSGMISVEGLGAQSCEEAAQCNFAPPSLYTRRPSPYTVWRELFPDAGMSRVVGFCFFIFIKVRRIPMKSFKVERSRLNRSVRAFVHSFL